MKRLLLLAIAPALAALVVAGCGGGGSGNTQPSNAATTTSGAAATVSLRKLNVGNALVDSQGRTLYLFEADKGPMSTCNGACASLWPPDMTVGQAQGRPGRGPGQARDHQAQQRDPRGHLQRPPAVPLRARHQGR